MVFSVVSDSSLSEGQVVSTSITLNRLNFIYCSIWEYLTSPVKAFSTYFPCYTCSVLGFRYMCPTCTGLTMEWPFACVLWWHSGKKFHGNRLAVDFASGEKNRLKVPHQIIKNECTNKRKCTLWFHTTFSGRHTHTHTHTGSSWRLSN